MKRRIKQNIVILLVLTIVLSVMLVGCQEAPASSTDTQSEQAQGEAETPAAQEEDVSDEQAQADPTAEYYMVTFVSGIDFWKSCYVGFEDAGAEHGAITVYDGTPDYDINEAITVLEQVIAKKPAGIAVTCMNPDAYIEPINNAIKQGIPIVTFDSDAPDSERYSFLATENYDGGVAAAECLAEQMGGKGEVAIVGTVGQLNLEQRAAGFRDTLAAKYPDISIVQEVDGQTQEEVAAQVTAALIQSNPNVGGIFASNANMGLGTATAIDESGKGGAIKLVSYDVDSSLLDNMEAGLIQGLIAQNSWNMGYWAFEFLWAANNKPLNPSPGWKENGESPLPAYVDTGVSVVTPENMQNYIDNIGS